jgi:hypothetical protein
VIPGVSLPEPLCGLGEKYDPTVDVETAEEDLGVGDREVLRDEDVSAALRSTAFSCSDGTCHVARYSTTIGSL